MRPTQGVPATNPTEGLRLGFPRETRLPHRMHLRPNMCRADLDSPLPHLLACVIGFWPAPVRWGVLVLPRLSNYGDMARVQTAGAQHAVPFFQSHCILRASIECFLN